MKRQRKQSDRQAVGSRVCPDPCWTDFQSALPWNRRPNRCARPVKACPKDSNQWQNLLAAPSICSCANCPSRQRRTNHRVTESTEKNIETKKEKNHYKEVLYA